MTAPDSLIRRRGSRAGTTGGRRRGRGDSASSTLGEQDMGAVLDHYQVAWLPMHGAQKVKCPFHDDGTASCAVNVEEGWLNCHACPATAGDPLQVVRLMENCDFATAKRRYAEITGKALADTFTPGAGPSPEASARVAKGKGFRPKFRGSLLE